MLIAETSGLVRVLQRRVHRETVNIGVIGQTGAGKSTLLRKLSGLATSTSRRTGFFDDGHAEPDIP